MRSRLLLTTADQALYSAGTLILQFGVLRVADAPGLATFGVVYAGFWLAAGSARAMFGESQLVARARGAGEARPRSTHVLALCALVLVFGLTAFLFVGASGRPQVLAMTLSVPAIIVTDIVRYTLLTAGRIARTVTLDAAWLVVQVALTFVLVSFVEPSPVWIIAAWGGGAALAVLFIAPRDMYTRGRTPTIESRKLGRGMAAEFMLTSGVLQLLPFILFAAGSVSALAALRAAQTIVAPVNLIFTVGTTVAYSHLASSASSNPRRVGFVLGGAVVVATLLYGATLVTLPNGLRELVVGQNWRVAYPILIFVLVQVALNGVASGGIVASRLVLSAKATLLRRVLTVPGLLVVPLVGVWLADTQGLGLGLALGTAIAAVIWWSRLPENKRDEAQ